MALYDYKQPFNIPGGLTQKFSYESHFRKPSTERVLVDFDQNRITKRDLEICEFLIENKFATSNQIHRYVAQKSAERFKPAAKLLERFISSESLKNTSELEKYFSEEPISKRTFERNKGFFYSSDAFQVPVASIDSLVRFNKNVIYEIENELSEEEKNTREFKIAQKLFESKLESFVYNKHNGELLYFYSVPKASLKQRLDKLASEEMRIINSFVFADEGTEEESTMPIYCLDRGGRILLEYQTDCRLTTSWISSMNRMNSILVGKNLLITELRVRLSEECPNQLVYFRRDLECNCGKISLELGFAFAIYDDDAREDKRVFAGDVMRKKDVLLIEDTVSKYESIFCTNAWKKSFTTDSFGTPPIVLFLTDQMSYAKIIGQAVAEKTRIKQHRIMTDDSIKRPFGMPHAFYRAKENFGEYKFGTAPIKKLSEIQKKRA